MHLIKWIDVCQSKRKGGLGIRNLSSLHRALLGKWIWRFVMENNSIWKTIIFIFIFLKYRAEIGGDFLIVLQEAMVCGVVEGD